MNDFSASGIINVKRLQRLSHRQDRKLIFVRQQCTCYKSSLHPVANIKERQIKIRSQLLSRIDFTLQATYL